MAVSEAKSFAIAASLGTLSPASILRAARCTSSRAASTLVAMSARRKATAWCSEIGLPNCSRDFAYSTAYSSAARAIPVAEAPSVIRDRSNVRMSP